MVGRNIVLASDAVDPDVFIWDTRSRLTNYAAGIWRDARSILDHTILAQPGTRAVIVACRPAAVRPRYSRVDQDAVGVRLLSGPYRGRYGWVLSEDIHEVAAERRRWR
jgi:hypothetical protein